LCLIMKIDLRQISSVNGAVLPLELSVAPIESELYFGAEIKGEITVTGKVTNRSGVMRLKGKAMAVVSAECSRCLAETEKKITADLNFILDQGVGEDTDGIIFLGGDFLDMSELAYQAIVLNLPMLFICKADCKGLCPTCGADLNTGACSCGESEA